jgi:hypothetical protein
MPNSFPSVDEMHTILSPFFNKNINYDFLIEEFKAINKKGMRLKATQNQEMY